MAANNRFPRQATATIMLEDGKLLVRSDQGTVDSLNVAAGGELVFVTPEDSPIQWWSVLWKNETPFDDRRGWASEARGRKKGKRIGKGANGGDRSTRSYHYAVVASDGKEAYFLDPEVVVGPEEPDEEGENQT